MKDTKIKQQLSAVKEAKIMSEMDDNPNVIKYYTSFLENDYLHILMEYANRGDLYKVSEILRFYRGLCIDFERAKEQEEILH